jgi:ATP-dependent Clp protease ATP-binding subunit ClpC
MQPLFSDSVQRVIALAQAQARQHNHSYVGTEHLLLGLLAEPAGTVPLLLRGMNVRADSVREQIESMIQDGPVMDQPKTPLPTPRAKHAFMLAGRIAQAFEQPDIEPEHLLLGLIEEGHGLAATAMKMLKIDFAELSRRAMEPRGRMLKIIERAVRPMHVGTTRRRRNRCELLDHLDAIFREECEAGYAAPEALDRAARRFGDPAALAEELQRSVTMNDRIAYWFERQLGWRAPESAVWYCLRVANRSTAFIASLCLLCLGLLAISNGRNHNPPIAALRPIAAFLFVLWADQFLLGFWYIKLRDAMFGVFGSPRSRPRVIGLSLLIILSAAISVFVYLLLAYWKIHEPLTALLHGKFLAIGLIVWVIYYTRARRQGPSEIRDTIWASLHLDESSDQGQLAQ